MGLVEHHEVGLQFDPGVHGVVELIAQNFGGADDDGGVRLLPAVAGEDPHVDVAEGLGELRILGIAQGLERAGVPGSPAVLEDLPDGLLGNPGLSGPCRGGHEAVGPLNRGHGLGLKAIGNKGGWIGNANLGEDLFKPLVGPGANPDLRGLARRARPSPAGSIASAHQSLSRIDLTS